MRADVIAASVLSPLAILSLFHTYKVWTELSDKIRDIHWIVDTGRARSGPKAVD